MVHYVFAVHVFVWLGLIGISRKVVDFHEQFWKKNTHKSITLQG